MKETSSYESVKESKRSFNKLLRTRDYQQIISDDAQRRELIELLMIQPNGLYLDLACGTGYVGFEIARRFPDSSVIGIDIADEIIRDNLEKTKEESLANIDFQCFDGIRFPVFDRSFEGVICRYALHHFPSIDSTLETIGRIVKPGGRAVIADAIKNEHDHDDFMNRFQGINRDGHVRMYTRDEMVSLFATHDFIEVEAFASEITFARELNRDHRLVLDETPSETKKKYSVIVNDNTVTLTFDILNVAFEYRPNKVNTVDRLHSGRTPFRLTRT